MDRGEEDGNVCPGMLHERQSARANRVAGQDRQGMRLGQMLPNSCFGKSGEACRETALQLSGPKEHTDELELLWLEWEWKRAALMRNLGFHHGAAQQMTCFIQWLNFQCTGNEPCVLWP